MIGQPGATTPRQRPDTGPICSLSSLHSGADLTTVTGKGLPVHNIQRGSSIPPCTNSTPTKSSAMLPSSFRSTRLFHHPWVTYAKFLHSLSAWVRTVLEALLPGSPGLQLFRPSGSRACRMLRPRSDVRVIFLSAEVRSYAAGTVMTRRSAGADVFFSD
jgi:hypothetical protein